MTKKSFKKQAIHLFAVTVLTTSSLGGVVLATTPIASAATVSQSKIKIDEKTAVQKFNKQFKNVKIDEIQLETKGNKFVYEISGSDNQKEYSADVNAKSGKVTNAHSEPANNGEQKNHLNLDKLISRKKANQIAEKAAKKGQGQSWTLENENGTPVWEVEVVNGKKSTEVKINAQSKKVLNVEQDN
ncbi:PepSY domain-containing protein [Limosilactobacillus fastidiosus]|uniref:PepSY domain-containing protein n=1 Tax=Limosilactobacillus fastidiosus TaxID=2759855 RepID=A0A7W3YBB7_9LACO|nr:PepSY domain-containing protein [Limosilactobacillus fastidiosus]MBB1062535.1 PepSY domain-containing protein [Limosilactobacillus fastidiosus]MBB1085514.1 PepSY domain-containing protein [Limosilactobacillus fastidiosus]MCD7083609.1 PepSY domain-containing protein [Limosilactobacillus fastidiosus]MCD7085967.1 PepSY domain-containing protein [Limosilactobacillus fastidiosus]MCD7114389.1 PepSY domain-containing protein [Limosilactobacillus fastidiosus]